MSTLTPQDIRRLSVKQYHAMIQAGILSEDDPVELLEGWLVNKMPKNPQHLWLPNWPVKRWQRGYPQAGL